MTWFDRLWRGLRARVPGPFDLPFPLVPVSVVEHAFVAVIGPALIAQGFAPRRPARRYTRIAATDLVHLVELAPVGCATYALRWGVSLGFVPHAWVDQPVLHRGARAARFDLSETLAAGPSAASSEPLVIDRAADEGALRARMATVWAWHEEPIRRWMDRARTLDGVAALAEEQAAGLSRRTLEPPPALIAAFCHARLGRADAARARLEEAIATGAPLEPVANLRRILEECAPRADIPVAPAR